MIDQFSPTTTNSVIIRRVQIKSRQSDALAARLHTERALQAASLRPIGIPRDAILIVRRLTAWRTGTMGWEQAVNAELDQLARQAARPSEGAVSANANAVIFTDRSELLACLAADWCAGVVGTQWWWQSLLRGDDVSRAVLDAWLAMPEYIPLALQRMTTHQQAIVFVLRLSDTQVRSSLLAVVHTFGLYELAATLTEITAIETLDRETLVTLPVPAPPWRPWVQTHVEHLSPDRQVLLGVGLMLHTAPSIVRSASFASEVNAWHAAINLAQRQPPVPGATTQVTAHTLSAPATVESEATIPAEVTFDMHSAPVDDRSKSDSPSSLRDGQRPTQQSLSDQYDRPAFNDLTAQRPTREAEAPLAETLTPTEAESLQADIETEFGGVCYFINLGLFLNLYGDFTTPLQPGLDLPIWDFMALVAQELCGDEVMRDPIWPLLAQLADRAEDEPPGANFDPARNVIASRAAAKQSPSLQIGIASTQNDAPRNDTSKEVRLTDLMSIIRSRLQLALGVSADDLPRYFKHHARIVVSELNFDAYFALADLPIEIRLSGLDRDPGWVPAAGRTVRFHYD